MTLNGLERRLGAPSDRPLTRSGGKMAGRKTGARLSWALVAAVGWLSPQRHARSIVVACLERPLGDPRLAGGLAGGARRPGDNLGLEVGLGQG